MVIARIERKPEQLCIGDELQVVSVVAQKGIRILRFMKDLRTKLAHPFVKVLRGPDQFWSAKRPRVLKQ